MTYEIEKEARPFWRPRYSVYICQGSQRDFLWTTYTRPGAWLVIRKDRKRRAV